MKKTNKQIYDELVSKAEDYAHIALELNTPYECHKNDFIKGATSPAAMQYWIDFFAYMGYEIKQNINNLSN